MRVNAGLPQGLEILQAYVACPVTNFKHHGSVCCVTADCDTCRWMAPDFFKRENEQSAVLVQPQTDQERLEAYKALLACPTCAPWQAGRELML